MFPNNISHNVVVLLTFAIEVFPQGSDVKLLSDCNVNITKMQTWEKESILECHEFMIRY